MSSVEGVWMAPKDGQTTTPERARTRVREPRGRPPRPPPSVPSRHAGIAARVGMLALAGLVLATVVLAIGSAGTRQRFFIPASRHGFPDWLAGPLHGLHAAIQPRTGAFVLVAMFGFYLVTVATAHALSPRIVWSAVVVAHVAMLLAPPLFSADVFGYVGYARLFVVHGVDPYLHGADAAPLDEVRTFVTWRAIATPYGPLFTFLSLPLAWVAVPVALWACKALAAVGSLLCVVLVGRIAATRGDDPVAAIVFLGLNPLLLVYEVGGGHNDMLPVGLLLLAILFVLRGRAAGGGASAALALGAKASAGVALPFVLLASKPRRAALAGAAAGLALLAVLGLVTFGAGALSVATQLRQQQDFVATYSLPSRLASLLGFDGLPSGLRVAFVCVFATTVAALLWAVWRERIDWIAGAGWATLALLLASAWLVQWYAVWLLPLAAVSRSRGLLLATLLFCIYVLVTRVYWLLL
jgi:hypothetical protein